MINSLKRKLEVYKGKRLFFKYNGSRNQIDEFIGWIDSLYPNIFVVKTIDGKVKSFSYNDVLIHKLVFKNE